MGSYNYLGFAQNEGQCADYVRNELPVHGCGIASTRQELGTITMNILKSNSEGDVL